MEKTLVVLAVIFITAHATPYRLGGIRAFGGPTPQDWLEYRDKCVELSGSDEGFQKAASSYGAAMQCVSQNIDMVQLSLDLSMLDSESRKAWLEKYCPKMNESVPCFDDVFEGAAMCVGGNSDNVGITKILYRKIALTFIELICKDNGRFIVEVASPEYAECLDNTKESGDRCNISDIAAMQYSMSQLNEEDCSKLKQSRDCMVHEVNICQTMAPIDMLDIIYQSIAEVADCKKFSSFTAVNDNGIVSNKTETD